MIEVQHLTKRYGRVTAVPTAETHSTEPISVHGVNSLAIESYAGFFARAYGLAPTILRCSNVYGPGQKQRGAGPGQRLQRDSGRP